MRTLVLLSACAFSLSASSVVLNQIVGADYLFIDAVADNDSFDTESTRIMATDMIPKDPSIQFARIRFFRSKSDHQSSRNRELLTSFFKIGSPDMNRYALISGSSPS